MIFFTDIIKGIFMGIANIIPGVSGGTMALSMGIYDKLIGAISGLTKDWKKSLLTLLPIMIGCGIGIVGFTYIIEFLLSNYTFVTCMAFIGLILGGLPVLLQKLRKQLHTSGTRIGISSVLAFIILFSAAVLLPLFGSDAQTLKTLTPGPFPAVLLFLIGIIASATMVVPGVSGSMVLMILGYYYGILDAVKTFVNALKAFDMPILIDRALVLFPFGIGVLLGIFLIAKLITFLFERYGTQTYCAILGLVLSSPIAIFYNTGLFSQLGNLQISTIVIGFVCAAVGFIVTKFIGEK